MVRLSELVSHLDELFELGRWSKADASLNGLQVEGAAEVERVALAVDAGEQTIRLAREAVAQALIVHHGLFWGRPLPIAGAHGRRVRLLLEAGLSLYALHLPLDFHPVLGHNVRIARGLGLEVEGPLSEEGGLPVGTLGVAAASRERGEFVQALDSLLGGRSLVLPFGPERVARVGIVSGSAAKLLDEALSRRIDTFVTGESSHTAYHFARELGVNLVFAGHYASETPGLRALAEHLERRLGLETVFLEAPTGL